MHRLDGHDYSEGCPPYMQKQFLCCTAAVGQANELVREAQTLMTSLAGQKNTVELEARLGSCEAGGFAAGVTEAAFNNVHQRLVSCREFVECHDRYKEQTRDESGWYTVHVFMHKDKHGQRTVRTETVIPSTGSSLPAEPLVPAVSHMCKKVLKKVNFRTTMLTHSQPPTPKTDFRLALSVEQFVAPDELDIYVETSEVHIKKRKDFTLCPTGTDRPAWRFSLTQRWKGRTMNDAELDSKTNPPMYEVELELIDPVYALQTDHRILTYSLLMKLSDLLGIADADLMSTSCYTMEPQLRPGRLQHAA
jgi:hypothetical protein